MERFKVLLREDRKRARERVGNRGRGGGWSAWRSERFRRGLRPWRSARARRAFGGGRRSNLAGLGDGTLEAARGRARDRRPGRRRLLRRRPRRGGRRGGAGGGCDRRGGGPRASRRRDWRGARGRRSKPPARRRQLRGRG